MSLPLHQMRTGHGRYKTEIIIILRKGKRTSPMMNTGKENVSPSAISSPILAERELDCLNENFQKGLDLNGVVEKDGRHFLEVMKKEAERMTRVCETLDKDISESSATEEVCGKVRAAIGKSKLLTTKKFKQFKGLCECNLGIGDLNGIRPTNADLAGFWDMVMIQVDDVNSMFEALEELRQNGWQEKFKPAENGDGLTRTPSLSKKASSLTRQPSFGVYKEVSFSLYLQPCLAMFGHLAKKEKLPDTMSEEDSVM
ncbi:predicted protein [Nematostella vectensis]|uniref:Uncharacterized protein n=1 Tax=Nematostella vectensis TaxID=45351 RepID=A7S061_NEMVE|nr:predicted protein [Nematostella vectensis]|eukprot:XP_001634969.1 predicted protein [Nematostella vectensis]